MRNWKCQEVGWHLGIEHNLQHWDGIHGFDFVELNESNFGWDPVASPLYEGIMWFINCLLLKKIQTTKRKALVKLGK